MNLRKIWTELFQKPAGRLILFLLAGALVFAFLFSGRGRRSTEPVNPAVPAQATAAKGYTFTEDIPVTPPSRPAKEAPKMADDTPRPVPTPKPPPPIPQAIFATKEAARSEFFLPYGRMFRCELVNTVDSTLIDTPIIGLITEDVWHDGRLVIPAGTEVHGSAQKNAARERIGSERQWMLVFQDGRELPLSGTVLDYAPDGSNPDAWGETDGSAGLRGYMIASDKYAEAKAILAAMISAGAGAFPSMTNIISPLTGGVTQVQDGGYQDAIAAGIQAGGQIYSQRLLEGLEKEPYYVRVPAGTLFYLYVTQTVNLAQTTTGLSAANSTQPQKMKYLIPIVALCLCSCATRKPEKPDYVSSVPGTAIPRKKMAAVRTPETVKAYPVGRYTDPNFPEAMHERHTVYRREQAPDWNYLPDEPYALPLGPTVAVSNPSPSYYVRTENELMNEQQRAYAEALQEQNRAMKKRIESLQQEAGKVPELEQEINRLKNQLDETPEPPATPQKPEPAKTEDEDFFSSVEPALPEWEEGISDPCEIVLFADSDDQSQAFLISQMRLHDEFAAELAAAERRKVAAVFNTPFLRRKELSLLTK